MQIQKTIKFKVGELSNKKKERLDLVLQKSLSCLKDIIQISIIENTKALKIGSVQKPIKLEDVSPPTTKVVGIRNIGIL